MYSASSYLEAAPTMIRLHGAWHCEPRHIVRIGTIVRQHLFHECDMCPGYPVRMRHTLGLLTVVCAMVFGGGTADAGHGRGGGHSHGRDHSGGVVVRDHRGGGPVVVQRGGRGPRVRHVRVNGGRYVFPGGVVRVYKRPVIRERYYNRRRRPAIIVEAYDPVPGYVWVAGSWSWGGGEWVWSSGYWAVSEPPPPAPVVTGSVGFSAGISIH